MIRRIASRTALTAVLTLAVLGSSASAVILQTFDFETGDLSQLGATEVDGPTASVTVSTAVSRRGNYAMKAYIQTADKRAEGVSQRRGTVGGVNWYGWSIYVPADYAGDGLYDIVSQFHDWHATQPAWGKDNRAPTCFLFTTSGNLQLDLKYQSAPQTVAHQSFNLGAYTKGAWHDIVVDVKWTHLSTGFMKVWVNGVLKLDYTGPTYMDYGAANGPYFKMGDYKGAYNWPGTSPRYFYMDEFRMGDASSTYDEVNPAPASLIAYEGFNYGAGSIASGGTGWASAWSVSGGVGGNDVVSGGFSYTGLAAAGNHFKLYDTDGVAQTVTRTLATPVGAAPGTYWLSFLARKNSSGREGYLKFGGLVFKSYQSSDWQVKTPGTAYTTLTGAGYAAMHLFLARVDAGATSDTVRVWVDPVLSAGEPATGGALVTLNDAPFSFSTVAIQHGPWGTSAQSGEWDEIRIGRDFESVLGTTDLVSEADAYAQSGSYAGANMGLETVLWVKQDTASADYNRESYLRFNLSAYAGTIASAKLVLVPTSVGTDIASSTFQVLLVSNDTWSETGITWNNRPAGSTVLATISGASVHVGQPLKIDVTAAATQQQAGDGKLSLVIVSTVSGAQRFVQFASYESGADEPLLRVR